MSAGSTTSRTGSRRIPGFATRLLAAYAGEILSAALNFYDCEAEFDGAWVHSTGSSGSGGGDDDDD